MVGCARMGRAGVSRARPILRFRGSVPRHLTLRGTENRLALSVI
jgi:hypothetical protein